MSRFTVLDAIRFVAAMMVVLGHVATWPGEGGVGNPLVVAVRLIYGNLVAAGPSAVIIFFVISGFCIHYPYRQSTRLAIAPFYVRRYVRIGLPMLAIAAVCEATGLKLSALEDSVLWSLAAELIYYTLYPVLFRIRRNFGWHYLLPVAFGASYTLVLMQPQSPYNGNYPQFGLALNWLLGLPCWLLGCLLAEWSDHLPTVSSFQIWAWRSIVASTVFSASFLRFHAGLSYPWTLNVLALVATLWLARELGYSREHPPAGLLVGAGQWSYSLYLAHVPVAYVLGSLGVVSLGLAPGSAARVIAALLTSYVFFLAVERPSHRLARYVSRRWSVLGSFRTIVQGPNADQQASR